MSSLNTTVVIQLQALFAVKRLIINRKGLKKKLEAKEDRSRERSKNWSEETVSKEDGITMGYTYSDSYIHSSYTHRLSYSFRLHSEEDCFLRSHNMHIFEETDQRDLCIFPKKENQ